MFKVYKQKLKSQSNICHLHLLYGALDRRVDGTLRSSAATECENRQDHCKSRSQSQRHHGTEVANHWDVLRARKLHWPICGESIRRARQHHGAILGERTIAKTRRRFRRDQPAETWVRRTEDVRHTRCEALAQLTPETSWLNLSFVPRKQHFLVYFSCSPHQNTQTVAQSCRQ